MRAIVQDRYGSPDVLALGDVEQPVAGAGELLVQVHAAGVDQGVWHMVAGQPYLIRPFSGLRRPKNRVPGRDVAGRVAAVGRNVTRFQVGDEVFGAGNGSFAEFVRVPADRCAPKPANLTFEQAAAVPVSGCTALQALRDRGWVQAGQHVLVIGAGGGVGSFAVQLAKAFGAEVTGVCSTAKVDLVRSIGADAVIDYTSEDFADGVHRYDVILDIAGNRALSHLRRALAPRGILLIIGGEGGGRVIGSALSRLSRGLLLSPFLRQQIRGLVSMERAEDLQFLREFIESGKVTPVIDRTYSLDEAPDAIRYLHEGHARGKVVITM